MKLEYKRISVKGDGHPRWQASLSFQDTHRFTQAILGTIRREDIPLPGGMRLINQWIWRVDDEFKYLNRSTDHILFEKIERGTLKAVKAELEARIFIEIAGLRHYPHPPPGSRRT